MTSPLENKSALVTGGGSGIGLACASSFAKDGIVVFVKGKAFINGIEVKSKSEFKSKLRVFDIKDAFHIHRLFKHEWRLWEDLKCLLCSVELLWDLISMCRSEVLSASMSGFGPLFIGRKHV